MDIKMPIMDGFTCTREVIKLYKTSNYNKRVIPVIIAMTALNDLNKECKQNGIIDYIYKPFQISKLNDIIIQYT